MQDKKIIGVIPVHYQSYRLPDKPLKGIYGKPCIDISAINIFVASLLKFVQVNFIQAVSNIINNKSVSDDLIVKVVMTENTEHIE